MIESNWHNDTTREAYFDFLESVDDPMDFARGWLDMHAGDFDEAVQLLGRRLKKDTREHYQGVYSDPLQGHLIAAGLRRIHWWQVAARILKRVAPAEVRDGNHGDSGDSGDLCI